eukprot:scaffold17925_cov56-Attheya_sp.AAC.1
MGLANVKVKTLKQKGAWNVPTPEEEKILALQTEVKSLKKNYKKKPAAKDGKNGKPGWLRHNRKPYHKKDTKKPEIWNNSKYYWCSSNTGGKCTGKWRTHEPSECKGTKEEAQAHKEAYSALAERADSQDSE